MTCGICHTPPVCLALVAARVVVDGSHQRLPAAVGRVLLQHGVERRARGGEAREQRPVQGLDLHRAVEPTESAVFGTCWDALVAAKVGTQKLRVAAAT